MENFKLELRGLGGEVDNVVINAEGCRIWFLGKCSDVQLYGLRLHNGNTSPGGGNGNGGLIYVSALTGRLFASHVRFTSSYAKQNGGALMLYGGGVIALSECSFSGNNADTGLGNDVCVSGKPDRSSRLIRCGMGSTSAHVQLHNDDRSNADNLVNIDDPCTLDYINDNYLGNGVCVTTTSTVTITTTTTSATETTTSATTTTVTTTSATTTTITVTTTTKTTTTITETTTTTVTTTTIRVCTEGKFYNADGNTCTTCPSGTFNNRPEHSIDACEPWTECTGDQFESKIPSAASDRVCGTTGECNFDLQFESKAPSEKTDRECTTFTICAPGEYVSKNHTKVADRICNACDHSKGEWQDGVNQANCKALSTCGINEKVSYVGSAVEDIACEACPGGYEQLARDHQLQNCDRTTTTTTETSTTTTRTGTTETKTTTSVTTTTLTLTTTTTTTTATTTTATLTTATTTSVTTTTATNTTTTETATTTTLTSTTMPDLAVAAAAKSSAGMTNQYAVGCTAGEFWNVDSFEGRGGCYPCPSGTFVGEADNGLNRVGGNSYRCPYTCHTGYITPPGATDDSMCEIGLTVRWFAANQESCTGAEWRETMPTNAHDNIGFGYISSRDECEAAVQLLSSLAPDEAQQITATEFAPELPCAQDGTRGELPCASQPADLTGVCGVESSDDGSFPQTAVLYEQVEGTNPNRYRPTGSRFVAICKIVICNHLEMIKADGAAKRVWETSPTADDSATCIANPSQFDAWRSTEAAAYSTFYGIALALTIVFFIAAYIYWSHDDADAEAGADADASSGHKAFVFQMLGALFLSLRLWDFMSNWGF